MAVSKLFGSELKVVNIGLESFTASLADKGVKVVQVEFKPPLCADPALFAKIRANAAKIAAANKRTLERILNSKPALVGLDQAINVIPGMKKDLILHAGPPVKWGEMCGPMRGAVIGALIYESLARNEKEAEKLAASGKIKIP